MDYGTVNYVPTCSHEQNIYHEQNADLFNVKLHNGNQPKHWLANGHAMDPRVQPYQYFVCMIQSTSNQNRSRSRHYSSEATASMSADSSEARSEELETWAKLTQAIERIRANGLLRKDVPTTSNALTDEHSLSVEQTELPPRPGFVIKHPRVTPDEYRRRRDGFIEPKTPRGYMRIRESQSIGQPKTPHPSEMRTPNSTQSKDQNHKELGRLLNQASEAIKAVTDHLDRHHSRQRHNSSSTDSDYKRHQNRKPRQRRKSSSDSSNYDYQRSSRQRKRSSRRSRGHRCSYEWTRSPSMISRCCCQRPNWTNQVPPSAPQNYNQPPVQLPPSVIHYQQVQPQSTLFGQIQPIGNNAQPSYSGWYQPQPTNNFPTRNRNRRGKSANQRNRNQSQKTSANIPPTVCMVTTNKSTISSSATSGAPALVPDPQPPEEPAVLSAFQRMLREEGNDPNSPLNWMPPRCHPREQFKRLRDQTPEVQPKSQKNRERMTWISMTQSIDKYCNEGIKSFTR